MGDEQKTGRVQTVMAPGDLRPKDDRSFARRIRRRSGAIRRLVKLGFDAEEPRAKMAAAPVGGRT